MKHFKALTDDANRTISQKDPASPSNPANQVIAQETARITVLDGTDRVPQFEGTGQGGVNVKSPEKHIYSETERSAISKAQVH